MKIFILILVDTVKSFFRLSPQQLGVNRLKSRIGLRFDLKRNFHFGRNFFASATILDLGQVEEDVADRLRVHVDHVDETVRIRPLYDGTRQRLARVHETLFGFQVGLAALPVGLLHLLTLFFFALKFLASFFLLSALFFQFLFAPTRNLQQLGVFAHLNIAMIRPEDDRGQGELVRDEEKIRRGEIKRSFATTSVRQGEAMPSVVIVHQNGFMTVEKRLEFETRQSFGRRLVEAPIPAGEERRDRVEGAAVEQVQSEEANGVNFGLV